MTTPHRVEDVANTHPRDISGRTRVIRREHSDRVPSRPFAVSVSDDSYEAHWFDELRLAKVDQARCRRRAGDEEVVNMRVASPARCYEVYGSPPAL